LLNEKAETAQWALVWRTQAQYNRFTFWVQRRQKLGLPLTASNPEEAQASEAAVAKALADHAGRKASMDELFAKFREEAKSLRAEMEAAGFNPKLHEFEGRMSEAGPRSMVAAINTAYGRFQTWQMKNSAAAAASNSARSGSTQLQVVATAAATAADGAAVSSAMDLETDAAPATAAPAATAPAAATAAQPASLPISALFNNPEFASIMFVARVSSDVTSAAVPACGLSSAAAGGSSSATPAGRSIVPSDEWTSAHKQLVVKELSNRQILMPRPPACKFGVGADGKVVVQPVQPPSEDWVLYGQLMKAIAEVSAKDKEVSWRDKSSVCW
jgi:hypothetical protein